MDVEDLERLEEGLVRVVQMELIINDSLAQLGERYLDRIRTKDFAKPELYVSSEDEKANYPRFCCRIVERSVKLNMLRKTGSSH